MLLCKQEEAGIPLNAEQADWRDDTNDDELKDQELEAHYMYMAQLHQNLQDVIQRNMLRRWNLNVQNRINAGLDLFLKCLNEEMVIDSRYFNSLELEVDSLTSQLEPQRTQFVNEIDRLSREYYYDDHINAILGVYTELDE
nr:hypothetical protein [Tanacetum cinerariifolium]